MILLCIFLCIFLASSRSIRVEASKLDPFGAALFWLEQLCFEAGLGIGSFQKNVAIFAFFSVLYKRTKRSLRSFLFFIKNGTIFAFFSILYKRRECSLRSFSFFIKERNILFGFISHTNIANLAKKERKRMFRSF